ncbi:MAG: hypothetical protein H6577_17885 [Lewinellaceae bacterium]|nr:phosphatidylinositol-specific phospholipase C/glycerophosphodiester phosphodiesterase family protein [Saprospiraceae bacterium]MCB9339997.1 hypothetical protein [Lewinellaceae bacterium]
MKHLIVYACVAASLSGGPFSPVFKAQSMGGEGYSESSIFPESIDSPLLEKSLPPMDYPLLQAHAHNDYQHTRPLFDALAHGFNSIEVDVHLINNELYVYHDSPMILDKNKTLKNLYLEPLRLLVEKNNGQVYPKSNAPLLLMVDIKTEALATYNALKKQLTPYADFISSCENGKLTNNAVRVFLSGNRPVEEMAKETFRLMDLDGRIEDLGKGYPPDLMPVISESFINVFGIGLPGSPISDSQWDLFKRLSRLVHSEGKKMRLWASPEKEAVWEKLLENGADFINTDELERLRLFFSNCHVGLSPLCAVNVSDR